MDVRKLLPYMATPMQLLWAISATASAASSSYLLLDLGFHYPCCMHLLHLGAVVLLRTLLLLCVQPRSSSPLLGGIATRSIWFAMVEFGLGSVSGVLFMQAILHSTNIMTLTMLAGVCLYLAQHTTSWRNHNFDTPRHLPTLAKRLLLLLLLLLCCVVLVFGDVKLTTTGLACVALGAPSIGLSRLLTTYSSATTPKRMHCQIVAIAPGACGLALTGVGVLLKERASLAAIASLPTQHLVWLFANTAASAVAILTSRTAIFRVDSFRTEQDPFPASILAVAGFTGCLTVVFFRHSYTTALQLAAYGGALALVHQLGRITPVQDPAPDNLILGVTPWVEHDATTKEEDRPVYQHFQLVFGCLGTCLVVVTWILFLAINATPRIYATSLPALDDSFRSNTSLEVVISMYKEPVNTVASLITSLQQIPTLAGAQVHIYIKAIDINCTTIQAQTGAHRVTQLNNVGRESETYLYHILTRWDELARHTLFVQAEVHNKDESIWRIRTFFDPTRTGMLDLGFQGQRFPCRRDSSDRWGWRDSLGIVSRVYNRIYHAPCSNVLLSYKGQFIVSAGRIRGPGKHLYQSLHQALLHSESWAHKEPFLQGRPDAMSAPVFGYTVERLWNIVFQCSWIPNSWQCPSFLSWRFRTGLQSGCQCLDVNQ